jgi:UDP-N-acetylmuramoyl-L-alanyl-D-glutamate--2,6-diaminopimelate ligase
VSTQFKLGQPSEKTLKEIIAELLCENEAALPSAFTLYDRHSEGESLAEKIKIAGLAYDSRHVEKDFAFFSIEGQKQDGNAFINQAIEKGASLIVSQKKSGPYAVPLLVVPDVRVFMGQMANIFFEKPSEKLSLLGVTGTNGKTTTTHLIEHIFNFNGRQCGLIGTLGARMPLAGKTEYLDVHHTTPQAADLQALLYTMAKEGVQYVAMEVSSHALFLKRVEGTEFSVGCLTNITQDHLDFHKTMEHYYRSKAILFEMLAGKDQACAVINLDDKYAEPFLNICQENKTKILSYGKDTKASIHPISFQFDARGTQIELATPDGVISFSTKLTGEFNLYNVMAAMAISLSQGISKEAVAEALKDFAGVAGRFEVVQPPFKIGEGRAVPLCIVDYAHTPDGLDNVLKAARALVKEPGKLIAVFGCGGDRDSSKRPQMGAIAEELADKLVVTSDNPRSEDPQQIIADILAGIKRLKDVTVEVDRQRAILEAVKSAGSSDVVVVAGKGHETYQILKDRTIDFDDRIEVANALKEREDIISIER